MGGDRQERGMALQDCCAKTGREARVGFLGWPRCLMRRNRKENGGGGGPRESKGGFAKKTKKEICE